MHPVTLKAVGSLQVLTSSK